MFGKQSCFVWLDVKGAVETLQKVKTGYIIFIHTGESAPVDGIAMLDQNAPTKDSAPGEKIKNDKAPASITVIAGRVWVAVIRLAVGNGVPPLRKAAWLQHNKNELAYLIAQHS